MREYLIKTDKEIKSCYGCPFCKANDDLDSEDYRSMYCSYPNMGEFVTDYDACWHPDCPLVEVPPHGRLKDVDEILEKNIFWTPIGRVVYPCDIDSAPTIIEASN